MTSNRSVLISGASFAGLSTAHWLVRMGYDVTLVEIAPALRRGGTAVDIKGETVGVVERMGLLERLRARRLGLTRWDLKDERDLTVRSLVVRSPDQGPPEDELEVERDVLLDALFDSVRGHVELRFSDRITGLRELGDGVEASFAQGGTRTFGLVFGCDGVRSSVRRRWFGDDAAHLHFLEHYFAISIVDGLLIPRDTGQLFNVPGKAIVLNAYKDKTDVIFAFHSPARLSYDPRDRAQQKEIIAAGFADVGWRAPELLRAAMGASNFYFDELCQVRMPAWSRGRVALVGDAAYCPSPAAGMGGSIALDGAAALAAALRSCAGDHERAFRAYEASLRPWVEQVQAAAVRTGLESLVPRTEDAIRARNAGTDEMF